MGCPKDWLIDGVEPNNWRSHRAALGTEAKRHAKADREQLIELIALGDWEAIQRHPAIGVTAFTEGETKAIAQRIKERSKAARKSRRDNKHGK